MMLERHSRSFPGLPALALIAVALTAAFMGGCATMSGPEMLTIPAGRFNEAFDAAIDIARAEGLSTGFRDRRSGVIITEPAHAASILEPWHFKGEDPGRLWENTVSNHQRRARFEFSPAGFNPAAAAAPGQADILGTSEQLPDLTKDQGDLELRVWVYIDRRYAVGTRKHTWSRRLTTQSTHVPAGTESELPVAGFWATVTRDDVYERRLLGLLQERMGL